MQSPTPETKRDATRLDGHSVLELFGDLTDEAGPRVASALAFVPRPAEQPRSTRKKVGIFATVVAALVLVLLVVGMVVAFATVIAAWAAGVAIIVMLVRGVKRLFARPIRAGRVPTGGRGASHP